MTRDEKPLPAACLLDIPCLCWQDVCNSCTVAQETQAKELEQQQQRKKAAQQKAAAQAPQKKPVCFAHTSILLIITRTLSCHPPKDFMWNMHIAPHRRGVIEIAPLLCSGG